MLEAPLFTAAGARAKSGVALPAGYFDGTVHEPVLHQAVVTYLANQRQGTAATKNRKMVSGGNQKPWRQKGTGRARQGSIRAPHWRGGGVVFGPTPRSYRMDLPVKVRRLARRSALNARAREGALYVIEPLAFEAPKTARLAELLGKLGLGDRKTLLLSDGLNRNLYLSGRNLPGAQVLPWAEATAYHVLWADVVLVERPALGEETDGAGPGRIEADDTEADEGGRRRTRTDTAAPRKPKKAAKAKATKTAKAATSRKSTKAGGTKSAADRPRRSAAKRKKES